LTLLLFGLTFLLIDRIKPWPFHVLEGLPAGWGVMADDLGVGLAMGAALLLLRKTRKRLRHA
jgi:phosphatidylglycerophosphatase A